MTFSRACIVVLLAGAALAACAAEEKVVSEDFGFDGTCVNCHAGLSAGQVHPTYKLRCVDCHGGDDQVDVPEDAHESAGVYRDPALVEAAHVKPKEGLARFFFANGIDDDGDGVVDEPPVFERDGSGNIIGVSDVGEIAELGLNGQGVGAFVDAEYNRDLAYTRWLNPGDLRVATMTCGGSSRAVLDGEPVGACHQRVVDTMRRSIMVTQAAVINGAYYGNESWRPTFQALRPESPEPRQGAFGYVLDFAAIDECIDVSGIDAGGRAQPRFDSECLERNAADRDPNAATGAPGNVGLPAFEAAEGVIEALPLEGHTIVNDGVREPRYPWGGTPLADPSAALPALTAVPDQDLLEDVDPSAFAGVPDPVDNILRGFRAYYPLNYPGSVNNFDFTFGISILPKIAEIETNNPFGRGHSSGCTACHMTYNNAGNREPQVVTTEQGGGLVVEQVVDPTTKHREFDPATQDIIEIEGEPIAVGRAVNVAETELTGREQQRVYSAQHEMTTAITTQQCGLCHAFVTRIDLVYQGLAEDEQRDELARLEPIDFTTPGGTSVRIHDSLVRNAKSGGDLQLIVPSGAEIARLATARNAELAAEGFIPGGGGCAPEVFTEDCNNNGELDAEVVLTRRDKDGELVEKVIAEDLNGDGVLDLIDHAPREASHDGRQMRYVYGGANGSTRLMDIHFERGMHCIDCHFVQDAHGDGNLYHTNWETIEIECEDCHGTLGARATLFTSGANGGNDLRRAVDHDGIPYFLEQGDRIIQRSRVTPGLQWDVPQVENVIASGHPDFNPRAVASMTIDAHMPDPVAAGERTTGSSFAGEPGESELVGAEMECYACHSGWVKNCMGCHYQMNLGDPFKDHLLPDGTVVKQAGENETWFNNRPQAGHTNFQLLSLMRSPFVLGVNAAVDGHRLAPFRSSMEVQVTVSGPGGHTLFDNVSFTTWQAIDANSGRANVATSSVAMNQTMPHTVRPAETKDCDWCHALVDQQGRIRNDHILAETYGLGAGRYPYVGDWAFVVGPGGLELFEHKQERELPDNNASPGASTRFPGLIINPNDRVAADVEPVLAAPLAGFDGTDVVFVRNFQPRPANPRMPAPPTLRDLAVVALSDGAAGRLMISDVTFRGHPDLAARPSTNDAAQVFVLELPGEALGLATHSSDISDPFVYVADGSAGLTVVELAGPPTAAADAASVVDSTALAGGAAATELILGGDVAYVGTDTGELAVLDLSDPAAPSLVTTIDVGGGRVNALSLAAFVLYIATDSGLAILDVSDPLAPAVPDGASSVLAVAGISAHGVYHAGGHAYVAAGADGVLDIDVTTPADPQILGDLVAATAPGETVDARDVVVSAMPVQTWLLVADAAGGDLVGLKLDRTQSTRERCGPDPKAAGCGLDMDWRDPTIMGRDPTFDPDTGDFDATDPSGPPFFRMAGAIVSSPRRIARPPEWEQIGTQTGRRLRDSFMPGSGVMSQPVMQRMYGVKVCEAPDTADIDGNGLGELGPADDGFFSSGTCTPFSDQAAAAGARRAGGFWDEVLRRLPRR